MTKQIILAETMGFCWGVRRTLDIIERAGDPVERVATIGDVIHNPQVVDRLRARGIDTAESVDEAGQRGYHRVAITAHGAGPERTRRAEARGMDVIDTTCPIVTRVQRLAQKLVREGYALIIYGDHRHPEARGIRAWADTSRARVAMSLDDIDWFTGDSQPRKIAILSQTTKNVDEFIEFARQAWIAAGERGYEVRICNTICEPTARRQSALRDLIGEIDALVVVGGKKSSNTTRLAEAGRSYGVPSYHIERADEIAPEWLIDIERVGVTAGASTPDEIILEVIEHLQGQGFEAPAHPFTPQPLDAVPAY
ncbi:MAG: 4-hydroxy-3-methylbut-2-enyl diphosphate reductase [Chloroflexota bacterium]